jgi:predicted aspartyl protease
MKRLATTTCAVAIVFAAANLHAVAGTPAPCNLADAPRADFDLRIPFDVIDGRIYVDARVDGHGPYRFAIDTGASGMARADASLVADLGLEIRKPATTSDGVRTEKADTTHFASLEVGGLSRSDLDVITRAFSSHVSKEAALSGIIAREFFADGLLVIDFPTRTLSFSRKLSLSPTDANALTYERAFRVPVTIGSLHTEGNLDTGANVAFVMPASLYAKVGDKPLEEAGTGRLTNSQIETGRAVVHGPFRIGGVSVADVEVRVSDRYPELLVGAHVLSNFVVMIDQRNRTVLLCD